MSNASLNIYRSAVFLSDCHKPDLQFLERDVSPVENRPDQLIEIPWLICAIGGYNLLYPAILKKFGFRD